MVLPNKWLRAGYGEPLRNFLVQHHRPVELVNFGHSPVFPDADTFPCVLIVAAGRDDRPDGDGTALQYCDIPREALPTIVLDDYMNSWGYGVPDLYLRSNAWSLEPPDVSQLMEKLRQHPRLGELQPQSIYRGIIPGLTEAFFVDQATRDRLVIEDSASESLLRKVLRGRNIDRWHPDWDGEWLILLKSSDNEAWPWATAGSGAEAIFRRTYPAVHAWMKPKQADLEKRQDKGRHWWELRSCSYYGELEKPKIVYQEIQFHSWFAWDDEGYLHNNKVFSFVSDQRYLTSILNSSLMWWYMSRALPHMKDEAFAMQTFAVEQLPVPVISEQLREALDKLVARCSSLMRRRHEIAHSLFGRFHADLGVERPSRRLETFWRLNRSSLADELLRAAPRTYRPLTDVPLLESYAELARDARGVMTEIVQLELEVQHLVFAAYGLSDEDIALVRRTAPPRDPLMLIEQEAVALDMLTARVA